MNRAQPVIASFIVIAALELGAKVPALAQSFAHWPQQCRGDLARLCRDVAKEEDKAILTCLKDNEPRLGQACRKLVQSYGHIRRRPTGAG